MTQERLQVTLSKLQELVPTAVFFDEAQKIGDGYRGILLEGVLLEIVRRNSAAKIVFASPMTENPEVLLDRATEDSESAVVKSLAPSVGQRLYWINPKPRHSPHWSISAAVDGQMVDIAEVDLSEEPSPPMKRLAAIPAKLANSQSLNIVYANTAADAEKCAKQIFEYLGPTASLKDPRIKELQDLIEKSVHPSYLLIEVIERGVAFHYGNMPQVVRNGVETLYRSGVIRFLVCTSTLLEGVNLPCSNIWIMNPRRGQGNPMGAFDFWNLAGRAGRWGAEFGGNIICIDTRNKKGWPDPPIVRTGGRISFASNSKLEDAGAIERFLRSEGVHRAGSRKDEDLEAVAAYLFDTSSRDEEPPAMRAIPRNVAGPLQDLIRVKYSEIQVPERIWRKHPGVKPQAMQRPLVDLRQKDRDSLPLLNPNDADARNRLMRVMARCERNLNSGFGVSANIARLSVLLVDWMRGRPVPWLISNRMDYDRNNDPKYSSAKTIRAVLDDIEQVARYRAPKFLSCYSDIVDLVAPIGDSDPQRPDVGMMLELGVSRDVEVLLMSLGMSRTATTQLSQFIVEDQLSLDRLIEWLVAQDLSSLGIPAVLVKEIEDVVERVIERAVDETVDPPSS